jgi:hypothetical protein
MLARVRQTCAAGVALEEVGVQPVLQPLHVLADGRLLRPNIAAAPRKLPASAAATK